MANTFKNETFRSGKLLGNITIGILLFLLLLAIINILVSVFMIISPDSAIQTDSGETIEWTWLVIGLVALIELVLRLACAVFFLLWLYRTFNNLPVLGSRNLEFSPGWAVGWWFIPFLNLGRPFQVVRELYRESYKASDRDPAARTEISVEIVGFWWAALLVSNFAIRISDNMAGTEQAQPSMYFPLAYLVAHLLYSAAAILALIIVRNVNTSQEKAYNTRIPTDSFLPPPPPVFGHGE